MSQCLTRLRTVRHRIVGVLAVARLLAVAHLMRFSENKLGLSLVYHRLALTHGHRSVDLVPALGIGSFERHLWVVRRAFAPVHASELPAAVRNRRRGQRIPLAVTFDDDLGSHVRLARPALVTRGVTATFFVCRTDGYRFWWELLQDAVDQGLVERALGGETVPEAVRAAWTEAPGSIHHVAAAIQALAPSVRDAVAARLKAVLASAGVVGEPSLGAEDLRALSAAGFEVGFHTRRHDFLPSLDATAMSAALRDGHRELCELTDQRVRVFAYPHGGVDEKVAEATDAAGFHAAFTTEAGVIGSDHDPMRLPRLECLGPVGDLAKMLSRHLTAHTAGRRRREEFTHPNSVAGDAALLIRAKRFTRLRRPG